MSILNYFPGKPRPGQDKILLEVERVWDKVDVIVLNLPVASGKSYFAHTIQRWCKSKSLWTVPTNLLVEQGVKQFPKLHVLHKRSNYVCKYPEFPDRNCEDCERKCVQSPYNIAVKRAYGMPHVLCNYYIYLAYKIYRPVMIFDEAHLLINLARERNCKRIWHKDFNFPKGICSYSGLIKWLEGNKEKDKKLKDLYTTLSEGRLDTLVQKELALYHNREELCLKLLPLNVSSKCDFLWPSKKVNKLVLMSATFNHKDLEDLGLEKRRVHFIEATSAIEAERRPFYMESLTPVNYQNQEEVTKSKIYPYISSMVEMNKDKGLIHAPYAMADILSKQVSIPRIRFHNKDNKMEVYETFFKDATSVLVGSGMYEGLSLEGDVGRWQLICKVPYPSLSEPCIKFKAETDPKWYAWETIKVILQAYGRICRGPEDYGATIILDSNFYRLYTEHEELFPKWFKEAIRRE